MNKTLILVVEDDRPIRNLIVTTLKHMTINIWLQKMGLQPFWRLHHTIRISFFWIWVFLIWKE